MIRLSDWTERLTQKRIPTFPSQASSNWASKETRRLNSFHPSSPLLHPAELDYYTLLGISRDAAQNDIKQAYHRTLMQLHPDKRTKLANPSEAAVPSNDDHSSVDIALIKEAYITLIDPSLRGAYDASLVCEDAHGRGPRPAQVVSLGEFTVVTTYERDNDEKHEWFYECRCGGTYHIVEQDLESGRHLVGCQSCSEVIWVGYELVED